MKNTKTTKAKVSKDNGLNELYEQVVQQKRAESKLIKSQGNPVIPHHLEDVLVPVARYEAFLAINSERDYQDHKWNENTTTSENKHSLEEWFLYIEDYVNEAKHILCRNPRQIGDPQALEIMRKVAGMAVCAMEQHGAPHRK